VRVSDSLLVGLQVLDEKRLFFLGTAEVPFTNQPKGQKSLEKDPFQILDVFVSGDVFTFQQ